MLNTFKFFTQIIFVFTPLFLISQTLSVSTDIPLTKVHSIDGVAWATPIGTSLTSGNIYWTYLDDKLNAVVVKKTLAGEVSSKIIMTNIMNDNNHAEMSLGVDNDGYIHVMGGHHNSPPQYYVSKNPEDITEWEFRGNDTIKGGIEGKGITYQGFYRNNNGTLFVAMRSNLINNFVTGDRSIALARYNTQTKKWKMLGGKNYNAYQGCGYISGEQNGMTAFVWNPSGVGEMFNASGCALSAHYQGYQLRIVFDKNNGMHVTYNMSDSININYNVSDVSKYMTHVFYAFSPDDGDNWFKANGQKITSLPITKANGDLVYKKYPAGYKYPNMNIETTIQNTNELVLDNDGKPMIMQGVYVPNETKVFKWLSGKWTEITYDISFSGSDVYNGLYRGETYNFASNGMLRISADSQNSWTDYPSITQTSTALMIDRYYLQKTGKLRYYSRIANNAGVVTLAFKGGEYGKKVYTVNATAINGTVTPGSEPYCGGLTATVFAKPNAGYVFDYWSGDASGSANPCIIKNINANKNIVANFKEATALKQAFENELIQIFPNPASTILNIETSLSDINLQINTLDGKAVFEPMGLNSMQKTIDVSNLAKGIYFVRFNTKNQTITKKLIVN